jgi:hypothetical protein
LSHTDQKVAGQTYLGKRGQTGPESRCGCWRRCAPAVLANAALAEKIEEWTHRPFAPLREASRRSLFEAIERDEREPVPATPFVVGR